MNYTDVNAETIDRWTAEGWEWGKPVDHETFLRAKDGDWTVRLTPTKPVPRDWLGDLDGAKAFPPGRQLLWRQGSARETPPGGG